MSPAPKRPSPVRSPVKAAEPRPSAPKPAQRAPVRPQGPQESARMTRPEPIREPARRPTVRAPVPRKQLTPRARAGTVGKPTASHVQRTRQPPPKRAHIARPHGPTSLQWYQVWASAESLGGTGCAGGISGRGYSELSLNPNQPPCSASGPFNALGTIPCRTPMFVRNAHTHQGVEVRKQDNGCGSTYNSSNPHDWASMGLYPDTIADLGFVYAAGKFLVHIARVDGSGLNVGNGIPIREPGSPGTPGTRPTGVTPTPVKRALYCNPLKHANVIPKRCDMGADYCGTGVFTAIADCTITWVAGNSGWPGGGFVEYRIDQPGPLQGKYVYHAENVSTTRRVGDKVPCGHGVATITSPNFPCTETGWGAGNGGTTAFRASGGHWIDDNIHETLYGVSMGELIAHLGGPMCVRQQLTIGPWPPWIANGHIPAGVTSNPQSAPGTPGSTGPTSNAQALANQYDWPNNFWNAFWELHSGMGEAAHHSHAAWEFAKGTKYITTKGRR